MWSYLYCHCHCFGLLGTRHLSVYRTWYKHYLFYLGNTYGLDVTGNAYQVDISHCRCLAELGPWHLHRAPAFQEHTRYTCSQHRADLHSFTLHLHYTDIAPVFRLSQNIFFNVSFNLINKSLVGGQTLLVWNGHSAVWIAPIISCG